MKFKKILKKSINKMPDAFEDFFEEAGDFFEDLLKILIIRPKRFHKNLRKVNIFGTIVAVQPAYIFAEKIESSLKILFGFSIAVSAVLATFWGFTRTSQLLETLIVSKLGRILIFFIGFSYLIIGIWKFFNIKK